MSKTIGIDLGTTNSVVAIVQGTVRVIQNAENDNITKSVVGYFAGEKIIGSNALDVMAQDPKNLIRSVKRLMGKGFCDEDILKEVLEKYLYVVKAPKDGSQDDIRVVLGGKEYSPIEISAMILRKIKEDAEERLNDTVEYATITVPAYFTEKQREATRLAGMLAGFKVQILLDEPTAAAIAFSVDQIDKDETRNIVVYDLGGGTFDVSVLTIAAGTNLRLNTEGDMWLGGDDFDHRIMDYVIQKVNSKEKGLDLTQNLRFMMELKKKAERAKIQLSNMSRTNITIPGMLQDANGNLIDVRVELTRDQLELMIEAKVEETIELVEKAIIGAGLTDEQIDNILLVGGSSTIPLVQRKLKARFGENKILKSVDPMLCVAFGAAILANRRGEQVDCPNCNEVNEGSAENCKKCGSLLIPVIQGSNMTYGIQTEGDKFSEIIPKNSSYPMSQYLFKEFKVPSSNLRRIKISVYAGEDKVASHNNHQFTVWVPLRKGTPEGTKLDVGFMLNENGVVSSVKIKLKDGSGIEKEAFINRDLALDGQSERGRIENKINELKEKIDINQNVLGDTQYGELDDDYQEAINALEIGNIEAAEESAKAIEKKIANYMQVSGPEWVIKAENLILWAELALARYGGDMDPDLSYRIKRSIESLKKAIEENQEDVATKKFNELNEILDELPPEINIKMRLTLMSFRASNIGRSDLSNTLLALLKEFDDAWKVGDIEKVREIIEKAEGIIDIIGTEVPRGGTQPPPVPQDSQNNKSSQ